MSTKRTIDDTYLALKDVNDVFCKSKNYGGFDDGRLPQNYYEYASK